MPRPRHTAPSSGAWLFCLGHGLGPAWIERRRAAGSLRAPDSDRLVQCRRGTGGGMGEPPGYAWSAVGLRTVMAPEWSARVGSEVDWSFGFHGQFPDAETGYYNHGFRYYSPEIGRWLNRDPSMEIGGRDLYRLTSNNSNNSK